jgi:hypothetical protein
VNANDKELSWPAWAHDRENAWLLNNMQSICIVNKEYLSRGEPQSMKLIDSSLRLFRVAKVQELGRAGIFGWRPGFKGGYVHINIEFDLEQEFSLELAKKYILEFIKHHPNSYSSGVSPQALSLKLTAARSQGELFALL